MSESRLKEVFRCWCNGLNPIRQNLQGIRWGLALQPENSIGGDVAEQQTCEKKISRGSYLAVHLIWLHSNKVVQKEKSAWGCICGCLAFRKREAISLALCAFWTIPGVFQFRLGATLEEEERQMRPLSSWGGNVWNHSVIMFSFSTFLLSVHCVLGTSLGSWDTMANN